MPMELHVDADTMTDEELAVAKQAAAKRQVQLDNALHELVSKLEVKFQEYAGHRSVKEQEWIEAERQYAGLLDVVDDKKLRALGSTTITSKPPVVNITRQKTNIATSRMQDIQFPLGGDYNFTLDPTEVPELKRMVTDDTPIQMEPQAALSVAGGPMPDQAPQGPAPTVGEWAESELTQARQASEAMKLQIADRLTQCSYGKKARRAIDDMCRIGTAIMKGPVHELRARKGYNALPTSEGGTVNEVTLNVSTDPTAQWVDPKLFYPDPTARPGTKMEDAFEAHLMTRTDLIKLSKNPGYFKERIKNVLRTEPDTTSLGSVLDQLSLTGTSGQSIANRYVVKEYHGPVDKKVLEMLGVLDEDDVDNPLIEMYGEVWYANGQCIRVSLSPLEQDDSIPYVMCAWEEDKSSPFGHGIPYLMRHAQRVVNSSWLMLLDNAGLTAGPQIVLNREMIEPASPEEGWRIEPMKVWFMTEYGADVSQAMQFVNIPTQQESIAAITELAMNFADIESSIPQIQAGEIPSGNNTMGGVAMVLSASHIIQQRVSERWDDHITVPLIRRFYDWEMQYGDNELAMSADMDVKAGGATERIDKQVKAQDIERILGLAGTNPNFEKHIDANMGFRELVATTRAGDLVKPIDQVVAEEQRAAEEAANAGPSPEQLQAEAQMLNAQTKAQEQQHQVQKDAEELEFKRQKEAQDVQIKAMEIQSQREENLTRLQLKQAEMELAIMKLAEETQLSREEIVAKYQIAELTEATKRAQEVARNERFNAEMAVKVRTGEGI